jgi:hypothetical protein
MSMPSPASRGILEYVVGFDTTSRNSNLPLLCPARKRDRLFLPYQIIPNMRVYVRHAHVRNVKRGLVGPSALSR